MQTGTILGTLWWERIGLKSHACRRFCPLANSEALPGDARPLKNFLGSRESVGFEALPRSTQGPKETSPILDGRHPKDVVTAYSGCFLNQDPSSDLIDPFVTFTRARVRGHAQKIRLDGHCEPG